MRPETEESQNDGESAEAVDRFESAAVRSLRLWSRYRGADARDARSPWLLAVSGGADSMALLHTFVRRYADRRLIVAHMNHHARPESDADEAFVREEATRLGLPFEAGHWEPTRKAHFEADARRARHEWLAKLAVRERASAVLTAHTRDDQAETVLMRLARGTGPEGMSGIKPWRRLPGGEIDLVRPLLRLSRSEILAYLDALGVSFRNDPTNDDVEGQTRAWVRHVLIPLVEDRLNPRFRKAVSHLAELQSAEQSGLDDLLRRRRRNRDVVRFDGSTVTIDLEAYRNFGPAWMRRRLLRQLWTDSQTPQRAMNFDRWCELDRWLVAEQGAAMPEVFTLPGFVTFNKSGDFAYCDFGIEAARPVETDPITVAEPIPLPWSGSIRLDGFSLQAELSDQIPSAESIREHSARIAVMDAAAVFPPVHARHPVAGDRFDPIGMGGRHQKIVDYLRIRGVNGARKKVAWLIEDQKGVVWVAGHGVADRAKVTGSTKKAWIVRIVPNGE